MGEAPAERRAVPEDLRRLVEGAERYRSLFTHNPHAVFSLDLEGRYEDVNPAAEGLSGYSRDELVGMNILDVLVPDEHARVFGAFVEVVGGQPRELESVIRHKSGTELHVNLVGVPVVVDGKVVGVHGVAEDVTERARAAHELLEARRAAEAANEAKSLFLANMSHELRTPLTTLLATAELLEDSDLDRVQQRFVDALQRAGQRLGRLIEDILDISRIEAGMVELRREALDLPDLLADVAEWGRKAADARGLRFDLSVDPALPRRVLGDQLRIHQVLTNLLDNAVKFTDEGFVELAAHLDGPSTVRVVVRDSGTGIAEHQQQEVFAPFTQADPSLTRRHEGAGLGLAIAQDLATGMGGRIELSSRPGVGTTVILVLPLEQAPEDRQLY